TYYEDSLPPAVDIGPGSPTGTVFGTGAKFPAKYQKSLFILDWTYSTIYAIDLQPDGSSYRGSKSDFVTGSPLPVTDAVVGSDGAFYFTAGGRGTQSALYRVSYVGTEPTAAVSGSEKQGQDLRQLRHRLEASHGVPSQDLDFVLKHLTHEDRFIRYAARIALESQPVESWRDRVVAIKQPKGIIQAALALARQGKPSDLPAIVDRLSSLKLDSLAEADKLAWLRAYELAFARLGEPAEDTRQKLIQNFDSLYPAATYEVNAELVQLLTFLRSPTVVAKTLALMDNLGPEPIPDWGDLVRRNAGYGGTVESMMADMPPVRAIHFAFVLRNVKTGWTMEHRQKYFEFFPKAAKHPGGNSFAKFLMQFRDDAIATCSPAEQVVLAPITNVSLLAAPIAFTPAKGPGQKWSTQQALSTMAEGLKGRNFDQGKNLFHATSCAKCHRLAGEGGAIGPDLSTAGKKFSMQDMLDAIVEPSKAISDQYGSQQVLTSYHKLLKHIFIHRHFHSNFIELCQRLFYKSWRDNGQQSIDAGCGKVCVVAVGCGRVVGTNCRKEKKQVREKVTAKT
ncbi:MAG: c-type cytochrome, partial [Pirellula sp.]